MRSLRLHVPAVPAVLAALTALVLPSVGGCGASNDKGNTANSAPLDAGTVGDVGSDASAFDIGPPSPGLDAGDDGSTFDPDSACAAKSFGGQRIPLAIAIIFDTSSSMSEGSPSKMAVAKSGLKKAFEDKSFDEVAVGLFKFGYNDGSFSTGCTWDTSPTAAPEPLSVGRTALFAEIDKLTPSGSTPTYDAMNATYAWLAPRVKDKKAPEDGKTAVILVTDGAPTCGTYTVDDYVALVAKARKGTMDTFFIGLPGTDEKFDSSNPASASAASFMSKCAARGTDPANLPVGCDTDPSPMSSIPSKPCYFDFHSAFTIDAFAAALQNIRKVASSCEYVMPTGDSTYDSAHPAVFVTDGAGARSEVPRCTDPTTPPDGGCWDWTDTTHSHVKLFGGACETMKAQDTAKVDILLPCAVR
ncbi:MAG: hypothetical protein NVSMB47_13550 [Polyangiales bacterium]